MDNIKTTIEFVNHASVLITYGKVGILSDPWYSKSVFHNGWRLLYENSEDYIDKVLDNTTHIYLSHEHPDHFNPAYLLNKKIQNKIIQKKIIFIFQKTKDRRVVSFLESKGFKCIEFDQSKNKINQDVEIQIVKHDFYDSSISIKTPDTKILNLNDCPLRDISQIKRFKKKYGTFDVLLTQFSYAAWKGGENGKVIRENAAKEKLLDILNQTKILKCKKVIPFASYIYFSNRLNFYMNDSVNTPQQVYNYLSKNSLNPIIMKPEEKQFLNQLKQNKSSLDFWEDKFQFDNNNKNLDTYEKKYKLDDIQKEFTKYQKKIFDKNSKALIYFLHKLNFLGAFQKINILFVDNKNNYEYSIFSGIKKTDNKNYDISMHSESLSFIFKNEFGFDTLTVNGCFECAPQNFSKVSKTLAIGSLNAMGLKLNLGIIFKLDVILLFLKKLIVFLRKLK